MSCVVLTRDCGFEPLEEHDVGLLHVRAMTLNTFL
jgi:hypothetical protein